MLKLQPVGSQLSDNRVVNIIVLMYSISVTDKVKFYSR